MHQQAYRGPACTHPYCTTPTTHAFHSCPVAAADRLREERSRGTRPPSTPPPSTKPAALLGSRTGESLPDDGMSYEMAYESHAFVARPRARTDTQGDARPDADACPQMIGTASPRPSGGCMHSAPHSASSQSLLSGRATASAWPRPGGAPAPEAQLPGARLRTACLGLTDPARGSSARSALRPAACSLHAGMQPPSRALSQRRARWVTWDIMDNDGEAGSLPRSSGPLKPLPDRIGTSADSLHPMGPPTVSDLQHIQAMLTSPANTSQGRTSTLARAQGSQPMPAIPDLDRLAIQAQCRNAPLLRQQPGRAALVCDWNTRGRHTLGRHRCRARCHTGQRLQRRRAPECQRSAPQLLTAVDWDTGAALAGVAGGGAVGIKRHRQRSSASA
jgi:hypothetical protein